jgi:hypothetical protein
MAARYREEMEDSRLLAVTEQVRKWLYPVVAVGKQANRKQGLAGVQE